MQALYVKQWGSSSVEEMPVPSLGAGEILVRVRATSINPLDWKIVAGYLADYMQAPLILGSDLAGDVEEVGEGVTEFSIGDAVYGFKGLRGGAYAEYTTVFPKEIGLKPKSLSYEEAAAVPHTGVTALNCLTAANIQAGQRILIHAAAGGVGHFAVQLAKLRGAYVIGTGSAASEDFIRELGADEFVDYNAASFEDQVQEVDVVLDTVGFDTTARSVQVVKSGGHLVSIVTPPPAEAAEKGITPHFIGGEATTASLTALAELIDAGKLKVTLQETFPFSQIQDAIAANQTGHTHGKIAVTID
jgi:NADPH:quinone reductase-like Zn-dependent oxidoreductase